MSSPASSDDSDESEYLPTPIRRTMAGQTPLASLPNKCAIAEIRQLNFFIQKNGGGCNRRRCRGNILPVEVTTEKLGGSAKLIYKCSKCSTYSLLETCSNPTRLARNKLSMAVQVAFITAGCTHATYKKVLDILGMEAVSFNTFMSTIRRMYPVVLEMVTEMCNHEKDRMKAMDQEELGSWSKAVTCADGTWQTRGFHSKNATFSVRNYMTGALLYFTHLCQVGRDNVISSELYKGTSKSAEGYGASELMCKAKEEGLNIAVHWQDGDSSSRKRILEQYPGAKIMLCGGHAGKAHLKQLQRYIKQRKFEDTIKKFHKKDFPEIESVECHCTVISPTSEGEKPNKTKYIACRTGCGCLTDSFCQRARNSFSNILSTSQSAAEFRARLRGLVHHVQDQHQWNEERRCDEHDLTVCKECKLETEETVTRQCGFHPLRVCKCGKCSENEEFECEGKAYQTRQTLHCPLHLIAYKIDCLKRIKMADQLVHPIMKRGHSNWLESSHNVLIRFRSKHIFLERLHYHVATNLGLLQANMTNEYVQQGARYHWKTELNKRLELPVYDDVEEKLEKQNEARKQVLDTLRTEHKKRERVAHKSRRQRDAQERIRWSKKHGQDTYGEETNLKVEKKESRATASTKRSCKKCGSNTHSLPTHHLCPHNKKAHSTTKLLNTDAKPKSDRKTDDYTYKELNPDEDTESPSDYEEDLLELDPIQLDDNIVSGCTCGTFGRSHKRECTLNPRHKSRLPNSGEKNSKSLNQRRKKTPEPLFGPGDHVSLHKKHLRGKHILCRVVERLERSANHLYRVCCYDGVISETFSETSLTPAEHCHNPILLENWRTAARITTKTALSNPQNVRQCQCEWKETEENETVDLTQTGTVIPDGSNVWIKNDIYVLHESDRKIIESPVEWLNDKIIDAAQKLMAQHFPQASGLEPPTLEQINGFQAHTSEFVQIVNTGFNHWIVVSTIGCQEGTVNVYDTMHTELQSAPHSTIITIARLTVCPLSTLTIKLVQVDRQKNSSDCGVLCVAIALDLLATNTPCRAIYDSLKIRQHLSEGLSRCCFTQFPVVGERSTENIVYIDTFYLEIFCVCRMPELPGYDMVQCDQCGRWFHQHCLDVENVVFENDEIPWTCGKSDCR